MKFSPNPFYVLILSIIASVFLSCEKDEKDASILVGIWDSQLIYRYQKYENTESTYYNEDPGFIILTFDGKYYYIGGSAINTIGRIKIKYSYDTERQIIILSNGIEIKVLKLTGSELETETIIDDKETYSYERVVYKRRIE